MSIQKIGIITVVMCMSLLVGCNLEDPIGYGEECPGVLYIQDGDNKCYRDDCGMDAAYFENERCPELQPFCIVIPGEDVFCASDCPKRTHILNDDNMTEDERGKEHHYCEADTTEHCGPLRDNCETAGWVDGVCSEDYRCVATKCSDTYRLDSGVCVRYSLCCGMYCAQCGVNQTGVKWFCSGVDEDSECIDSCLPPMVSCDELCVDPKTDNIFCGADDSCKNYKRCVDGQLCVAGACADS